MDPVPRAVNDRVTLRDARTTTGHGAAANQAAQHDDSALDKVLSVLEAVVTAEDARSLGEIAGEAGVAKSTTHRLLTMLVARGYATRLQGGRYGVGPRMWALAARVRAGTDGSDVTDLLRDLQARVGGHTIHLAIRSGESAVFVHKIGAVLPVQMSSRVGVQVPLHATAAGKCILSSLEASELDQYLRAVNLTARTRSTITDRGVLTRELDLVRRRGYAIDDEENELTIRCLAAPIGKSPGGIVGAISVSTVVFAIGLDELEPLAPLVIQTASAVSRLTNW